MTGVCALDSGENLTKYLDDTENKYRMGSRRNMIYIIR